MKKYWHTVTAKNLTDIQKKTLQYIKNTKERYTSRYHIFPWQEFTETVPEILTVFDHLNLSVIMIAGYFMKDPTDGRPHRDTTVIPIRANLPILNTENTYTTFWEPKQGVVYDGAVQLPNGLKYYPYRYEDIDEQTQCEISVPTLIRPMEIHSVEFDVTNPTPRITLTLTLDPIPYEYFPDIPIKDQIRLEDLVNEEWRGKDSRINKCVCPGYL